MEGHRCNPCSVRSLLLTKPNGRPRTICDEGILTDFPFHSNVPGVALYYTSLQQVRYIFAAAFPWAVAKRKQSQSANGKVSTLPVLSHGGNMAAGALTRTAIGLVLNPLTIVKARFEVGRPITPVLFHTASFDVH
jgi:hypothetical protein